MLESELLGFYFFPVVAICLLLTLRSRSWLPFAASAVASVVCLVLGNRHAHDVVLWWPAMMTTTLALLGLACAACGWLRAERSRAGERVFAGAHSSAVDRDPQEGGGDRRVTRVRAGVLAVGERGELVRPDQPCTVVVPGRSVPHQGWLDAGTKPFFSAIMYHPHDLARSCPKLVE